MIPRRDPETAPVAVTVQLLKRMRADQYGTEKARGGPRNRLVKTRNGLPVTFYVYRGSGRSLTFSEAKECLLCSD